MNIEDLRSFVVIARHSNLRTAALELHQTPSALSKVVKRLEQTLGTSFFQREGKSLRLNAAGERFALRAKSILEITDTTLAEFNQNKDTRCTILAPSMLLSGYGAMIAETLGKSFNIRFGAYFEDAALVSLSRGEADLAMVTADAMQRTASSHLVSTPLGEIRMILVAHKRHPISERSTTTMDHVLEHEFACLDHSPFCGLQQAGRSDGWRDDLFPRRIVYWLTDLHLQLQLVRNCAAIAYMPEFVLNGQSELVRIHIADCPHECIREVRLAYPRGTEHSWTSLFPTP